MYYECDRKLLVSTQEVQMSNLQPCIRSNVWVRGYMTLQPSEYEPFYTLNLLSACLLSSTYQPCYSWHCKVAASIIYTWNALIMENRRVQYDCIHDL